YQLELERRTIRDRRIHLPPSIADPNGGAHVEGRTAIALLILGPSHPQERQCFTVRHHGAFELHRIELKTSLLNQIEERKVVVHITDLVVWIGHARVCLVGSRVGFHGGSVAAYAFAKLPKY